MQVIQFVKIIVRWVVSPTISSFSWPFRAGARDFQMAYGVWQSDPNHHRGRACAFFYAISGCCLIALVGAVAMAACVCLGLTFGALGLPQQNMFEVLLGFLFATSVAFGLIGFLGCVAVIYARRHGLRIWIDQNARPDDALDGRWPPLADEKNGVEWEIGVPMVLAMITAFLLLDHSLTLAVIVPMLIAIASWVCIQSVTASHPDECYPEMKHSFRD